MTKYWAKFNGVYDKNTIYKSTFIIGNIEIKNTKKFNWFNKIMFKIVFGITIKDYEEDNK